MKLSTYGRKNVGISFEGRVIQKIFFWNFDVCLAWWCLDGPINGQERTSFYILCGHYQNFYDWISPLNKQATIYSNTAVYGEKLVR